MRRIMMTAAACATAGGLLSLSPAASASADGRATHQPAAAVRQAALAALHRLLAGPRVQPGRVGKVSTAQDPTPGTSANWAGYADDNTSGNTYGKVSGKWDQPALSCNPDDDEIAPFAVGIDGYNSPTFEGDGTIGQCYQGSAYYYTWWQTPKAGLQVVGSTVQPGDKIAASVTVTGTSYAFKVTDSTTSGNYVHVEKSCTKCRDASAEWIVQAASGPRGYYPLPDFGTWSLSSAAVTSGSTTGMISSFPDDEITMTGGSSYDLATPGSLDSSGSSFQVTWDNSF